MSFLHLPTDIKTEILNKCHAYEVYLISLSCIDMRKLIERKLSNEQIHKDVAKFAPVSIVDYMVNTCSYRIPVPIPMFISHCIEGDNVQIFQSLIERRWDCRRFHESAIIDIWKLTLLYDSVSCFRFLDHIMEYKLTLSHAIKQRINVKCFSWLLANRYVNDDYIRDIIKTSRYDLLTYICSHKLVKDKLHLIYAIVKGNEKFISIISEYYPELTSSTRPDRLDTLVNNEDLLLALDAVMIYTRNNK